MEVPRLGVKSDSCTTATQIRATSATYTTPCGNARSLTYWTKPGIEPASSWTLYQVLNPLSHNRKAESPFLLPALASCVCSCKSIWPHHFCISTNLSSQHNRSPRTQGWNLPQKEWEWKNTYIFSFVYLVCFFFFFVFFFFFFFFFFLRFFSFLLLLTSHWKSTLANMWTMACERGRGSKGNSKAPVAKKSEQGGLQRGKEWMDSGSTFEELICLAGDRRWGRGAVREVPQVSGLNTFVDSGLFIEMEKRGRRNCFETAFFFFFFFWSFCFFFGRPRGLWGFPG